MPSRKAIGAAFFGTLLVVCLILVVAYSTQTSPVTTTPPKPTTPTTTPPITTTTTPSPPVTTTTPPPVTTVVNWCKGGIYCTGAGIPESASKVGAVVCGANNYKYVCKQPDPKVAPSWITDMTMCATGLPGRCPNKQVVYRNNGTVSGNRYCGGVNGAPWWNELPVSWNGAKCVSAGFNGVNGVSCDVVPGEKPGFMVLCAPTGLGWNK